MRGEEGGADDRIAHILTEAQQAMKAESTPAAGADEKPPSGAQSPSRTVRGIVKSLEGDGGGGIGHYASFNCSLVGCE